MYRGYFIHIILELIKWGFRTCYILFLNLVISTPGAYRTKKNDQSKIIIFAVCPNFPTYLCNCN
jgi:hypothetical protein